MYYRLSVLRQDMYEKGQAGYKGKWLYSHSKVEKSRKKEAKKNCGTHKKKNMKIGRWGIKNRV